MRYSMTQKHKVILFEQQISMYGEGFLTFVHRVRDNLKKQARIYEDLREIAMN